MQAMNEHIEQLVKQLEGDNPCGESAKYEPEYEAIDEEISKMQALEGADVDWSEISTLAEKILADKSKDLLITSYYVASRFILRGYEGLSEALMVLDTLIEKYWEHLYPEKIRMRGRIAALTWLSEQLQKATKAQKPLGHDFDSVKSSAALLSSVEGRLKEHLGSETPDFSEVLQNLNGFLSDQDRVKKERDKKVKASEQKKASGIVEVTNDTELTKALNQTKGLLTEAATYLRKKNIADENAYRLLREASWQQLMKLPPMTDGKLSIGPVSKAVTDKIVAQMAEGKVVEAVEEIEQSILKAPFWFAGNKLLVDALQSLEQDTGAAEKVVATCLGSLLQRMPELESCRFNDGSPLFDDETLFWLNQNYVTQTAAGAGNNSLSNAAVVEPWEDAYREAKSLAAKGKFSEGLSLLNDGTNSAVGVREKTKWQLKIAQFSLETNHQEAAVRQLEYLEESAVSNNWESWDPALDNQIAISLLSAYSKLVETKVSVAAGVAPNVIRLYSKLCRTDLNAALKLSDQNGLKRILTKMFEIDRR
ncbi:MAG: type VI secretion system protein TssA [Gammaproteobacteria bacterium]|nr:type VI secretion system protein TssA [Gammaproteobacteria bacterium]